MHGLDPTGFGGDPEGSGLDPNESGSSAEIERWLTAVRGGPMHRVLFCVEP